MLVHLPCNGRWRASCTSGDPGEPRAPEDPGALLTRSMVAAAASARTANLLLWTTRRAAAPRHGPSRGGPPTCSVPEGDLELDLCTGEQLGDRAGVLGGLRLRGEGGLVDARH